MRKIFYNILVVLLVISQPSGAHMWGTGMWGGQQGCNYDQDEDNRYDPEHYIEEDEELDGLRNILSNLRQRLSRLESQKDRYEDRIEDHQDDIFEVITQRAFEEGIVAHFDRRPIGPRDYQSSCCPGGTDAHCVNPDSAAGRTEGTQIVPTRPYHYASNFFRFIGPAAARTQSTPLIYRSVEPSRTAPVQNIARRSTINRFPAM